MCSIVLIADRRLKRGMSKTTENIGLVNKARNVMLQDITEGGSVQVDENNQHYVDTPEYTFILPDLTQFADDLRAFLHKDLIETSTLVSLEQAGRDILEIVIAMSIYCFEVK